MICIWMFSCNLIVKRWHIFKYTRRVSFGQASCLPNSLNPSNGQDQNWFECIHCIVPIYSTSDSGIIYDSGIIQQLLYVGTQQPNHDFSMIWHTSIEAWHWPSMLSFQVFIPINIFLKYLTEYNVFIWISGFYY